MTLRAGLYARFSSELQKRRSNDDQLALDRAFCVGHGWTVAREYRDDAASGGSLFGRPGFAQLTADAEAGLLDVVVAEDVDRFSRNLADIEMFRERMEFMGVAIWTIADGEVTQMHAALKGLTSSIFLKGHAQRTRNRQGERAREGKFPGGLTYGYAPGASKGERVIVEHEAQVVRRIFADYVSGQSPRAIAERLNAEGVKAARGRDWLASSINGNPKRGSGILANTLYDGRLIWNRVAMRKDRRTGKRVSRPNPESEWIETAVPALRIVDAETFAAAQRLKAERGHEAPERARRPRHLLAGLLRCGCCGHAMVVNNVDHDGRRIYCSRRKEGGACANGATLPLAPIEARVVEGLKSQLENPAAIARYLETYRAERRRLARTESGKRHAAERTLAQATREIERVVAAIAQGTIGDDEARVILAPARDRKRQAEAELASLPVKETVVALHPKAVETYLDQVRDLAATLRRRTVEGGEDVAQALRDVVEAVDIHPQGREAPRIEVRGRLAALTGEPIPPHGECKDPSLITLVAGARYRHNQRNDFNGIFSFAA